MPRVTVPAEVRRVFDEWEEQACPPQPAVAWQRDRWVARYPPLTATFNALPAHLDRATVRAIVGQGLDKPGMFDAIVATYAGAGR